MKKIIIGLLIGIGVGLGMSAFYIYLPESFSSIDNRLRDFYFISRGKIQTSQNVVIVDIDEKSIHNLGQWPWQRNKFAKVLDNLTKAGAGIIGLDIVFAEHDNSSPRKVLKDLNLSLDAPDYDEILAKSLASSPTIAGYVFNMTKDEIKPSDGASIPGIFVERNKDEQEFLLMPYRPILNIPILQDNVYSSGFFNTIPDTDSGIIRSVPLLMKYDYVVYPSLALEMIRNAYGINKVIVEYDKNIGALGVSLGDMHIPTDMFGRIFVNFRGPSRTFRYISAYDIYTNNFDPSLVKGKFVLVGTSAAGLLDLRAMPFDSVYPGVEIHANVIDNILQKDFISRPSWLSGPELLMIFLIPVILSVIFAFSSAIISLLFFSLTIFGFLSFNYYMLFEQGLIFNTLYVLLGALFAFIFSLASNYFLETRQKNMIKNKFASKVSMGVMEDILKNSGQDFLLGIEKEISIFFSDIRSFTNISEKIAEPKKLLFLLNNYLEPMTSNIVASKGTIDKYIGDAIMAYWNAPLDLANHADVAVSSAIDQLAYLDEVNAQIRSNPDFSSLVETFGQNPLDIGIGINTGLAVVGEIGSKQRSDYTIIGDSVNLASRVEGYCKYYGSRLNITGFTLEKLKKDYVTRRLDRIRVKGKQKPIELYQVLGYANNINDETKEDVDAYQKALDLYCDGNFRDAKQHFLALKQKSALKIYDIYIERSSIFEKNPPKDFDGIFDHTSK